MNSHSSSSLKKRFMAWPAVRSRKPRISAPDRPNIEAENAVQKIEWIENSPFYRLRGRLLPLIDLGRELGFAAHSNDLAQDVNIVVLESHNGPFGLIVDQVQDTVEIVVKPTPRSRRLGHVRVVAA